MAGTSVALAGSWVNPKDSAESRRSEEPEGRVVDRQELLDLEERKARQVVAIVDTAILRIMNEPMTRETALGLVAEVRSRVLELFPDKAETFDLIYLSRFQRTIDEHVRDEEEPSDPAGPESF